MDKGQTGAGTRVAPRANSLTLSLRAWGPGCRAAGSGPPVLGAPHPQQATCFPGVHAPPLLSKGRERRKDTEMYTGMKISGKQEIESSLQGAGAEVAKSSKKQCNPGPESRTLGRVPALSQASRDQLGLPVNQTSPSHLGGPEGSHSLPEDSGLGPTQ